MLKPAQLYETKLQEENIKSWYNPKNIYWDGGAGGSRIEIQDDNFKCRQFVSVDRKENILGYITYAVDWASMSAYGFGIISFKGNSVEFARDVYQAVCDIFRKYGLNRMEWHAYADNPAIRGYRNFIKKYGGRECGYSRQVARLQDGKLHDSVMFEILAKEFKQKRRTQK